MSCSNFEIIYDVNALGGTNYVEIFPEVFKNKFWNTSSIFLTEESFEWIAPVFQRCCDDFDLYTFNNIDIFTWQLIIKEMKQQLVNDLQTDAKAVFMEGSETNLRELISWLEKKSRSTNCISVLGL